MRKGQKVYISGRAAHLLHRLAGIKGDWVVRFLNPNAQYEMLHCWNEKDMKTSWRKFNGKRSDY